jgi:integrase
MKSRRRKTKTYEHRGISIRELRPELPEGGGGYLQVDHMTNGHRERRAFDTLAKAQTYCEQIAVKLENEGSSALSLSPAQREDAAAALAVLAGKGSLLAAAKLWARHNGITGGVTVAELGRRWLAALKAQGCRDTTLAERSQKVERLAADMGSRPVSSMTRDDVASWLQSKGMTGATWDSYRRAYRAMFQFAAEERMVESNPVAAIKPMRTDEKLPTPFTVEAATAILRTAAQWTPEVVPTLAVQFFAGLRPGEALGLDWSAVDFKGKTIRIMPETSKVRRTRIIEKLNPVLFDWLLPHRKASGPIGVQSKARLNSILFMKRIGPAYEQKGIPIAERKPDQRPKGLAAAAGVEWIQDGCRKTFASAHYALHGDAAKLASILGHTGGHDVLFKHYRGLMTKAEARRFFAIRPASYGAAVVKANFQRVTA